MANEKRLIDANWILGVIEYDLGCYEIGKLAKDESLYVELKDIVRMVCDAPTVDAVEVVHGYWYEHHGITICSHCQAMFDEDLTMLQVPSTWEMPNYCPNCGAKMDGGNEDG